MRVNTIITLTIFLLLIACQKEKDYIHLHGDALGTTFSIKYQNNTNYSTSIDSLFTILNNSLSTYHANSIISEINRGDSTVITDNHFENVFLKAKRIYGETNANFDPTVGTLVNAWGFGPEKTDQELDSNTIKELMRFVGFDKVNLSNHTVKKDRPQIYIDFNAIAKGYSVDVIGLFFESKQIENYMVEIGGEMRVRGFNPNGKHWKVGIEKPLTDGSRAIESTLRLNDQSMATSGNYRKFRIDQQGKKHVHTINPKTGYPEQNKLLSASVISKLDCADVDAYATAFMVMGVEKTKEFLQNHTELQVVLIYLDDKNEIKIYDNLLYN